MKSLRKTNSTSRSCSCTSCIFNSDTDRLSLQKLLLDGSRIDRLYYGKYIPLRERKLLDKLVRTRAVYDDIRAQLVSDSTSSLHKNANFKRISPGRELDDTEKSSAVLELVNLVDKGAALKSSKLSECCSCCSCSSNMLIGEHTHRVHKHRHAHVHGHHRAAEKRYEFKKRKGVRFKAKHIKSDPCTCTFQFSGLTKDTLMTDDTENIDEGDKPNKFKAVAKRSLENVVLSKTKLKNKMATGIRRINESKTKLQESIALRTNESLEKLKMITDKLKPKKQYMESYALEQDIEYIEGKTKTNRLKNLARSSREKLRSSQTKLKNKIQEGGEIVELHVKKSIEKIKKIKNKIKAITCECRESSGNSSQREKELALKIRKDSIRKFKENLKRKQVLQDWTCEDDCIQGACDPEECYEKLKIRRANKKKLRNKLNKHAKYKVHSREISINAMPEHSSSANQAQQNIVQKGTTGSKMELKIQKGTKPKKDKEIRDKERKGKKKLRQKTSLSSERKEGSRQAVRIGSSFSFNIEFSKNRSNSNIDKSYPQKRTNAEQSSVIQISRPRKGDKRRIAEKRQRGSQVKLKLSKKDVKQKGYALKRCFCTLKLKSTRHKSLSQKSVGTMSSLYGNEENLKRDQVQRKKKIRGNDQYLDLLPYECEPGICIPYKCNPYECLKLQKKRLANQDRLRTKNSFTTSSRKTRSTSSVTPKIRSSKAKQVQSAIIPRRNQAPKKDKIKMQRTNIVTKPNRNVVRIGSTFSFDIEFFKESGNQRSMRKQTDEKKPHLHSITVQPKIKEKKHTKNVKKMKEKNKKRRAKTSSTGTETAGDSKFNKNRSKATKTGSDFTYFSNLEPYECEPYTCIPGQCDPYICLENIKKRYKQTREVSLGTISPESKSTSSYAYSLERSRDAFAQSRPKTKGRKVLVKTKEARPVGQKITPERSNIAKNKVRNVVSVGSSFSFNVEFSKSYVSKEPNVQLTSSPAPLNIRTKRTVKHKGIKLNKITVDNVDTQIDKVKHSDKSSTVMPVLKRCFCTLNLYKKHQKENQKYHSRNIPKNAMFTVNTALIKNTIQSKHALDKSESEIIYENLYDMSLRKYLDTNPSLAQEKGENTRKYSTMQLTPTRMHVLTKQSLEINSDLSVDVKLIKKSSKGKLNLNKTDLQKGIVIQDYETYSKFKESRIDPIFLDTTKADRSYFNRYFCTMNMQLENKFVTNRKLKPYECEPGVCIPGQCDPYECQKLIMKRLQKAYSKSSATDSDSRSISSSQTQKTPTQSHLTSVSFKPDHKNRQAVRSVPRPIDRRQVPSDKKQAVRIGSSFSFDVEFYKKQTNNIEPKHYDIMPQRAKEKQSTKERKMIAKYDTHDSGSQSDRHKVRTKTSQALQGMQRCFCTLKLQKKGKVKPKPLREESISVKTTNRGQNTKPIKMTRELLPYECEPGICIPGECDPYECLERINRRKQRERGTDMHVGRKRTTSSATSSTAKRRKSRAIYVQPKRQPKFQPESIKSDIKPPRDTTRQAVRIGSSFSFNIDFYKDSSPSDYQEKIVKTERYEPKHRPQVREVAIKKRHRKNLASSFSQSQDSQTLGVSHKTSATDAKPFLERCFCTLQLHKKKKQKETHEDVKKPQNKSVMTMTKKKFHQVNDNRELLPYECEPFFCTPGECDPLVCYERIKQRNLKSSGTATHYQKRKSTGSTPSYKKYKHKQMQFHRADKPKETKTIKSFVPQDVVKSGQKQAVRIGSNFSFNIEFFKDSGLNGPPHYDVEVPMKKIKERRVEEAIPTSVPRKHKFIQDKKHLRSGQSQTIRDSKSVKSGIIPNLERCFCTLALMKNKKTKSVKNTKEKKEDKKKNKKQKVPPQKTIDKDIQTKKSRVSVVSTFVKNCLCKALNINSKKQSAMSPVVNFEIKPQHQKRQKLEPYECEPGICIPGECDPYECEKRIKRRLLRENATETKHIKFDTHSSSTPIKSYKSRHVKTKPLKTTPTRELPVAIPKSKPIQSRSLEYEGKNKQCVRIGSTFSFDIEFFKDKSASEPHHQPINDIDSTSSLARKRKRNYKSSGQQSLYNVGKYNASQLASIQTEPSSTNTDPFLKRCFCTLQFHKSAAKLNKNNKVRKKPLPNAKQNKSATTKKTTTVSYMTCPNECPPLMCIQNKCTYAKECEKKFKKRTIKKDSRKVGGSEKGVLHKSVDAKSLSTKTKKVQAKLSDTITLKTNNERDEGIVEIPRFTNYLNKENRQAVKFGSNFSLNIEFYKELIPPAPLASTDVYKPDKYETCDKSNCLYVKNKNIPVKRKNFHDVKSQSEKSRTESRTSNTVNKLKRCFCTLKLQRSKHEKMVSKPPFPQVIEVRRVEIQKNNKKNTSKKTNTGCREIGTKIDAKLINEKKNETTLAQKKMDKMTTILPYQPNKFNKNPSKTVIKDDNKLDKKKHNKPLSITNPNKRLTRKKSREALYCAKSCSDDRSEKHSSLKHYLCRCENKVLSKTGESMYLEAVPNDIVRKKQESLKVPKKMKKQSKMNQSKSKPKIDDLKTSHSERQTKRLKTVSKIKTSRSLKLSHNKKVSDRDKIKTLKGSPFDNVSGDSKNKPFAPLSMLKKSALKSTDDKTFVCPKCLAIHHNTKEKKNMKVNFKDIPQKNVKKDKSQQPIKKSKTKDKEKKPQTTKISKQAQKSKSKNLCESCAKSIDEKCKYCKVCFQSESQFKQYLNIIMKQLEKLPIMPWIKKIRFKDYIPKTEGVPKPLFDVYLESDSFKIINKEEVDTKVKQLHKNLPQSKTKHGPSCKCCICLGKKDGKSKKVPKVHGIKLGSKCICGSEVCAKTVEDMKGNIRAAKEKKKIKPCVCGSPVCKEESTFIRDLSISPGGMICSCAEEMEKRRQKEQYKNQKEYEKRRKKLSQEENKEDNLRRKLRLKEDLRLEKSINNKSGDTMLAVESVVDVAKLGITGITDILRVVYRCVRDPRHTARTIKSMKEDPRLIGKTLRVACSDSGVASTARRVKKRIQSMESVRAATELLEQYPVTNYLLHIADKDPKKRLRKIKKQRRKERIDFHCNLFMSSLRKRPFLWIYDRWPWFYPHCLSFLNVWKQFAEVMLFLLAVVVWSPCIFAMEVCRAVMCCTLCTG